MSRKIILASTSPRRRELLESTGVVFEVEAGNYEEDMTLPLPPRDLAMFLSRGKAESVAASHPDAIIIAADTFIAHEGAVLGKPHTEDRAREMLRMLSGKAHTVVTGFTIIDTSDGKTVSDAIESTVYFKVLQDQEIDEYIATGEPLERAGAYAIQGIGKKFIEKYEGDYASIIGLPVGAVVAVLKEWGVTS